MTIFILLLLVFIWGLGAAIFITFSVTGGEEPVWWEVVFWPLAIVIGLLK